jgi:hypothetical protein
MGSTGEPEIPKKYKAVVYDEPGKVSTKVVELDTPEPGPGEVLIHLYVTFHDGCVASAQLTKCCLL